MHVVGRLMVEGVAFRRSGAADVPGKLIQVRRSVMYLRRGEMSLQSLRLHVPRAFQPPQHS